MDAAIRAPLPVTTAGLHLGDATAHTTQKTHHRRLRIAGEMCGRVSGSILGVLTDNRTHHRPRSLTLLRMNRLEVLLAAPEHRWQLAEYFMVMPSTWR